jgi:hypothetical protein
LTALRVKTSPPARHAFPDSGQEKAKYGQDYFDTFPMLFATTVSYKDLTILPRGDDGQIREYSVSYDVTDDVPRNNLYDKRKQVLADLTGSFDLNGIGNAILANLDNYYDVPADKKYEIAKYLNDTVTIDEAIDPFFITRFETDLRRSKIVDLKRNARINQRNLLVRHFVHRINMTKEKENWKLLNVERSFIANY